MVLITLQAKPLVFLYFSSCVVHNKCGTVVRNFTVEVISRIVGAKPVIQIGHPGNQVSIDEKFVILV